MRLFILIAVVLGLAGCVAAGNKACTTDSCSRPLSTPEKLVIWWSPSMRDGLPQDQDTTSHSFTN
ncbi:HrpT family type III secretion system protein [Pokkaliibacter sp. MBI-7]|uniref:Type III secretion protein n=1 Tax=Proteobacteria bacterium 228 TaxID=2083153 RepID=A0A2S5KR65_9PROT|nr:MULTISPECIES: HrpT family type III secretion system protein [Pokkaliibacter]MDH2435677.1 HrpT family type III secretion system protein [Pokkaliibacter sp. MBI-7]PPC77019.1 type III secretion protein [Pokkaliibacter plantistimulans]